MGKDKYVLVIDEDTQSLIINSLLALREEQLKAGNDIDYISDAIVEVCNATKKKGLMKGDRDER